MSFIKPWLLNDVFIADQGVTRFEQRLVDLEKYEGVQEERIRNLYAGLNPERGNTGPPGGERCPRGDRRNADLEVRR
jgi:hypothetical protein